MMLPLLPFLGALTLFLLGRVSATALTYKLAPNEKTCFFSFAEQKGQKLAFYFAVRLPIVQVTGSLCGKLLLTRLLAY